MYLIIIIISATSVLIKKMILKQNFSSKSLFEQINIIIKYNYIITINKSQNQIDIYSSPLTINKVIYR